MRKGLECVVEENSQSVLEQSLVTAPITHQPAQPSITEPNEFSSDAGRRTDDIGAHETQGLFDNTMSIQHTLVQPLGVQLFGTQCSNSNELTYTSKQHPAVLSGSAHPLNDTAMLWPPWRTMDNQPPAPSIPVHIGMFPGAGPMTLRKMANPVAQNNANHIIRALRTYPQRMLRRETFPPFIHQHWPKDSNGFVVDAAEPITNCMTIAQIFASRTLENTAFIWRTIRAEQQRLVDEVCLFRKSKT